MTILIPSSNMEQWIHILCSLWVTISPLQTKRNWTLQGELSHCNPKASYVQMNKKKYEKQLAQIERRHARIRCIQQKFPDRRMTNEDMTSVDDRYEIGSTEKFPEYIPQFLNKNAGDPAIKAKTSRHISTPYSSLIPSSTGLHVTTQDPSSTACSEPSAIGH